MTQVSGLNQKMLIFAPLSLTHSGMRKRRLILLACCIGLSAGLSCTTRTASPPASQSPAGQAAADAEARKKADADDKLKMEQDARIAAAVAEARKEQEAEIAAADAKAKKGQQAAANSNKKQEAADAEASKNAAADSALKEKQDAKIAAAVAKARKEQAAELAAQAAKAKKEQDAQAAAAAAQAKKEQAAAAVALSKSQADAARQTQAQKSSRTAPPPANSATNTANAPLTKWQQLSILNRRYQNDEVSPLDYQTERAKILAEPETPEGSAPDKAPDK
jgi:NADH dehydrogenase/NADH:ubiquinone oxidoreductase subunit G